MSIPLAKLFGRGQGALAVLPGEFDPKDESKSSTLATILSFVRRDQTAFDALFAVPPTYEELRRAYPANYGEDLSGIEVVDTWIMTMAICEIGINRETSMQLKRIAANAYPGPCRVDLRERLSEVRMRIVSFMLVLLIDIRVMEYGLDAYTRSRAVMCVDMDLWDMWEGINGFGM